MHPDPRPQGRPEGLRAGARPGARRSPPPVPSSGGFSRFVVTCPWACTASTKRRRSGPNPPTTPSGEGAAMVSPDGASQRSPGGGPPPRGGTARATPMSLQPFSREPGGAAALTTTSAVIASRSRVAPRRRCERRLSLPAASGSVAASRPEGRDGGRGGRPSSRATSSRRAWLSARATVIVACRACASARGAAASDRTAGRPRPARRRGRAVQRAKGFPAMRHPAATATAQPAPPLPARSRCPASCPDRRAYRLNHRT